MRHLIDPADFTLEETLSLMDLADRIHDDPAAYKDVAARKRLARRFFYEPSTRTRLSFEAAMLNLGGQVLGFPGCRCFQRLQGRNRSRYHPRYQLCGRHCRKAPPPRKVPAARVPLQPHSGHQRR